jgi:hypothetical protein
MARSLRSSGVPSIAERRLSMVDTELAFMPRSAVPEAQAVI